MNKKIIAIAIAAAMSAPAMAAVKVSGGIGAALTTTDTSPSSRGMSDNGLSKVEFSGNDGDAIFKIGMDVRSIMGGKGAGATINGRDFWLGYKFGSSTVKAGRMPAALAGLEGDKYNATFLEARRTAAVATTDNNLTDTYNASPIIEYAVKAGAVKVKVQYDPADNVASSGNEGMLALAVSGKAGPVGYFAGYNNGTGNEGGSSTKQSNTKIGASMKFGAVKATLMLMNSDDAGTKEASQAILADMGMGNGLSAGLGYGMISEGVDKKDTWLRLALNKSLTKNTRMFGGATSKVDDSTSTTTTTIGFGMGIKF